MWLMLEANEKKVIFLKQDRRNKRGNEILCGRGRGNCWGKWQSTHRGSKEKEGSYQRTTKLDKHLNENQNGDWIFDSPSKHNMQSKSLVKNRPHEKNVPTNCSKQTKEMSNRKSSNDDEWSQTNLWENEWVNKHQCALLKTRGGKQEHQLIRDRRLNYWIW